MFFRNKRSVSVLQSKNDNVSVSKIIDSINDALESEDYVTIDELCSCEVRISNEFQYPAGMLLIKIYKKLSFLTFKNILYSSLYQIKFETPESHKRILWKAYLFLLDSGLSPDTIIEDEPIIHLIIENANDIFICEKALNYLVQKGVGVNVVSSKGFSPLGALLINGHLPSRYDGLLLLKSDAMLNEKDIEEWKLYKTVFRYGMYKIACSIPSRCIEKFAKMDEKGITLLHYVAGGMNIGASDDLQSYFNDQYKENGTYPKLAELLLKNGADINAKTETGVDALSVAKSLRHLDTYDVLLRYSNRINGYRGDKDINLPINGKATALFTAAFVNDIESVKSILARGADPNVHSFVNYRQEKIVEPGVPPDVSKLLLQRSTAKMIDQQEFFRIDYGMTNLYYPSMENYVDVVSLLLEAGEDPNALCFNGLFPLYVAAEAGNLIIVKNLISHGAIVDLESPKGFTSLYNAAEEGRIEVVDYLLSIGANPRHVSWSNGMTPLDGALNCNQYDTAQILRKYL